VIYDPAIFDRQFAGLFRFQAAGFYHGVIRVRGDSVLSIALFSLGQLSTPSFTGFGPDEAALAYLQSYGMLEFLSRVSGERALRVFVEEIVRTRNLPRAIQRAFRSDLPELEAGFQAELG